MTNNLITLYTTTWCGYCKNLKKQLLAKGIPFQEIDIEQDPKAAEHVGKINGGNQVVPTLEFWDSTTMTNPRIGDVESKLAERQS